jgi:hypothetical protein
MTPSEMFAYIAAFVFGWVVIGPILAVGLHVLLERRNSDV